MTEAEPVPISALQHYAYCPRQCALIHVEQTYDENLYTLRGRRTHDRVDQVEHETLDGKRVERALPLYSAELGLTGRADVVEVLDDGTLLPVEYKAGARRHKEADEIQLCAQALCLEEMFQTMVAEGSLYYASSRRRRSVAFTSDLRAKTRETIEAVRELLGGETLPPPVADNRCPNCSLIDACIPYALAGFARVAKRNDPFHVEDEPS